MLKQIQEEKDKQEAYELELATRGIVPHLNPFPEDEPTRQYDSDDNSIVDAKGLSKSSSKALSLSVKGKDSITSPKEEDRKAPRIVEIDALMESLNAQRELQVKAILSGTQKTNYQEELQKKYGQAKFDIKNVMMDKVKMSVAQQKFNSKEN